MKRILLFLLLLGMSFSALSQTKMFINKSDGTIDSMLLSDVKSISIKSGSSYLVQVAGGTFQMGTTVNSDEQPVHQVSVGSFNIDIYEITYEKWTDICNWGLIHGYTDLPSGSNGIYPIGTNNPVTYINWYDIMKWCNARSEKDGLTPVYYTSNTFATVYRSGNIALSADAVNWTANGYRLPTEAEWEFAARGGNFTQGYIYSGSNTIGDVAWYYSNSPNSTHTVGTKTANELGIYDMSGNAWEWCWDWYGAYLSTTQTDPKGPTTGTSRVLRGGSFSSNIISAENSCRIAARFFFSPSVRDYGIGFRCVQK